MGSLRRTLLLAALSSIFLFVVSCRPGGPVVPDNTARAVAAERDDRTSPDEVFLRDPWERWDTPNGAARYHRGTFMLLPNDVGPFRVGDIAVYAKDGSDVRLDYNSTDFGAGSQSLESISIFISRAAGDAQQEWASAVAHLREQHPGAEATEPFPIPVHYPADTRQAAYLVKRQDRFVQVSLFRRNGWTVRYEINCPVEDIAVAREKGLAFLREVRYRE